MQRRTFAAAAALCFSVLSLACGNKTQSEASGAGIGAAPGVASDGGASDASLAEEANGDEGSGGASGSGGDGTGGVFADAAEDAVSADGSGGATGDASTTDADAGAADVSGSGGATGDASTGDAGNDVDLLDDASTCARERKQGILLPLDMYIMFDQSLSMAAADTDGGPSRWSVVVSALKTFLDSPTNAGIGVGIQYFGNPVPTCSQHSDCGTGIFCVNGRCNVVGSCDPTTYATPDVEIAQLPASATSVKASLDAHQPATGTPTTPALEGAIDHVKDWLTRVETNGHHGIVLLVTDGLPDSKSCSSTTATTAAVAASGLAGTPSVPTWVIGIGPESSMRELDQVALSGGSGTAFVVDTASNVAEQFSQALERVRRTALVCSYAVPTESEAGSIDFDRVNVIYTASGGGPTTVMPNVGTKAGCDPAGPGWYYDNPTSPTKIIVCDGYCPTLKNDQNGVVQILLGCLTVR